jgi:hypothetical protein
MKSYLLMQYTDEMLLLRSQNGHPESFTNKRDCAEQMCVRAGSPH